jgi:hypothetical protein
MERVMEKLMEALFWAVVVLGALLALVAISFRIWEDWQESQRTAPWRNAEAFRKRLQKLASEARGGRA